MTHTRIIVRRYGGPETLEVVQEPCPEPKAGEVRVRVLAAGVALPDVMMREGVHPETPRLPFTPGWDLVGEVERVGPGVSGIEPSQRVAALPIFGAYAEFVCLPQRELVPVPSTLDPAQAVCLILNYVTAYQMLHRSVHLKQGDRVLIHGAAGGVGSALLQLGRLAGLTPDEGAKDGNPGMYGTCSSASASAVCELGGVPIDYHNQDFVAEIHRRTGAGVDVVFDGIGGSHVWRSREALRPGGRVVVYGFTGSLSGGRLASCESASQKGGAENSGREAGDGHAPGAKTPVHEAASGRHRFRLAANLGGYVAKSWLLPGRKRLVPYSIQWLKRIRPAWFRKDLAALLDLLQQQKLKPLIARRFPLAQARQAHELLGQGSVIGKIVLVSRNL